MLRLTFLAFLVVFLGGLTSSHALEPLPSAKGEILLTVVGEIDVTNAPGRAEFDRAMLEALGRKSLAATFVISGKKHRFEGVPLRAVLDRVGGRGGTIRASAWNDYEVDIPWDDLKYDPLLAMSADGEVLSLRDKGPLWIVYPRDDYSALRDDIHDSRWVWQLNRLRVLRP
ncbi:oxidoreductase [Microvirga calopogonii]|uniref:oxidoreductase n=1 Tax=Microvirga calopogonii TaxID=2078013 RepID=UPI000E0CDA3D|nr:oxidoreductase [Microvirga calopogonii]